MKKLFKRWFGGGEISSSLPAGMDSADLRDSMANLILREWLIRERRDHMWTWFKRIAISGGGLVLFAVYLYYYAQSQGFKLMPNDEVVGVVKIQGDIMAGSLASASKVIPSLEKAFNSDKVKAVILEVDSPGGQPNESEQITRYIDMKKKETGKKVVVVSRNVNASAAYLISIHADEIYAGKYSIVGSIGAVMKGFDFHKVLEKVDVKERVFASGRYKNLFSPFSDMTPDGEAKLAELVNAMGGEFANEVKQYRGARLKPNFDYFTGEAWNGEAALKLGLIDGIGTVDQIAETKFHLKTFDFGPNKPSGFASLGATMEDVIVNTVSRIAH